MINTLRSLLYGTAIGNDAVIALVWCTAIGALGLYWSTKALHRQRPDQPS